MKGSLLKFQLNPEKNPNCQAYIMAKALESKAWDKTNDMTRFASVAEVWVRLKMVVWDQIYCLDLWDSQ